MKKAELYRQFNISFDIINDVCKYYQNNEDLIKKCLSVEKDYLRISRLQRYGDILTTKDLDVLENLSRKDASKFLRKCVLKAKYGDENFNNSKQCSITRKNFSKERKSEILEKRKHTLVNRFGENYKEELKARRIQTCLQRYGVENPMQVSQIKEKSRKNQNKKYGRHREKIVEKTRKTNLKKYGVSCIFKLPNFSQKYPGHITKSELEIHEFLKELGIEFRTSCRNVISTPQKSSELDIYIPSKNIAIEYNGLYWHSDLFKSPTYHQQKSNLCREKGIRLLHFFGDDWEKKNEICKSILKSSLGIYDQKIFARNCTVREVSSIDCIHFLSLNHIQGHINSSKRLGLYFNNELVQVICLGKSRFKKDEFELYRMCTKLNTQVVGGFSKLLSHLDIDTFITYVDLSLFNGSSYYTVGFTYLDTTKPNYWYLDKGCNKRISRLSCQKHKLEGLLGEKFDPNLTELQNMRKAEYIRLFDSGSLKLRWNKNKVVEREKIN